MIFIKPFSEPRDLYGSVPKRVTDDLWAQNMIVRRTTCISVCANVKHFHCSKWSVFLNDIRDYLSHNEQVVSETICIPPAFSLWSVTAALSLLHYSL